MYRKIILALSAAFVVFGLSLATGCKENTDPSETKSAEPKQSAQVHPASPAADLKAKEHTGELEKDLVTAPDFTLPDQNGKEVKLSDLIGKKIVVLEWANWDCPFVKWHYNEKTFAHLIDKYAEYDNIVWLTINSTHYASRQDNLSWAKQHNLNHSILADPSGAVGRLYGATNTPQLVIIDMQGHIAYEGAIDNAPMGKTPQDTAFVNYVDQALTELTAGKPITTPRTKPYGCTVKYSSP